MTSDPRSLDQLVPPGKRGRGRPRGTKNTVPAARHGAYAPNRRTDALAYNIAWMLTVDKRNVREVCNELGLEMAELRKITEKPFYTRKVRELHAAIGTVREAALKRYTFEVEGLVELAIDRIRQILDNPEAKDEVVLKAATAILDRAGVSAARKIEGTIKFELPEPTLKRIEEAVKELPMIEQDDGEWAYAFEKPKVRPVDDELGTSEPKDEGV